MNKIVVKIGGSLLFTENSEFDITKIKEFCSILQNQNNYEISAIICGGGVMARKYIKAFRKLRENEAICDILGIEISRVNARILLGALGESAYPIIPKNIKDLAIAQISHKLIVMGGIQPGQSTTSVALEVAEFCNINHVVILTDVRGIYDKDPKKYKGAKLLDFISPKQLETMMIKNFDNDQAIAGEYRIFDMVSLQILKRSNMKVTIMSGNNLEDFNRFINGEKDVIRTEISPLE